MRQNLEMNQLIYNLREGHSRKWGFVSELSKKSGVSRDKLYQWISGRGTPKMDNAHAVDGAR